MARQIIKQPNGKFCIFSSVVDNIIYYHMEEKDIINFLVEESKKDIEEHVKKIVSDLNEGKKPYHQHTMSYEEMVQTIKEIHGTKEANKIKKHIEV
jgi:hypothetical protein